MYSDVDGKRQGPVIDFHQSHCQPVAEIFRMAKSRVRKEEKSRWGNFYEYEKKWGVRVVVTGETR